MEIPANTTAEVIVPDGCQGQITEGGEKLDQVTGVIAVEDNAGGRKLTVGSGSYRFTLNKSAD